MTTTSTADPAVAPPSRRPLPGRLRVWLCVGVAAIVLLLDQATKVIAVDRLTGQGAVDSVVPFVDWVLVRNENAAFGIPGFTGMFVLVTIVVLALVAKALPRTDRLSLALAYGLVCGGALGNVGDRLFRPPGFPDGAVVDFINIGWWPTFNIADMAIVSGATMIVGLLMLVDREARQREEVAAQRSSVRPGQVAPQGAGHGRGPAWMTRAVSGHAPAGSVRTAPTSVTPGDGHHDPSQQSVPSAPTPRDRP